MLTGQSRYASLPASWRKSSEPLWSVWKRKRQYGELQVCHIEETPEMPSEGPTRAWVETPAKRLQVPFKVAIRVIPPKPRRLHYLENERGLSFSPPEPTIVMTLENCVWPATGELEPWAMEVVSHFGHAYCEYAPHAPSVTILARVDPVPYSMLLRSRSLKRTALHPHFCFMYAPAVRAQLVTEPIDLSGTSLHYERALGNSTRAFEWLFETYLAGSAPGTTTPARDAEGAAPGSSPGQALEGIQWPPTAHPDPQTLGRLLGRQKFRRLWKVIGENGYSYDLGSELTYVALRDGVSAPEVVAMLGAWFAEHSFDVEAWSTAYVHGLLSKAQERIDRMREEVGA